MQIDHDHVFKGHIVLDRQHLAIADATDLKNIVRNDLEFGLVSMSVTAVSKTSLVSEHDVAVKACVRIRL